MRDVFSTLFERGVGLRVIGAGVRNRYAHLIVHLVHEIKRPSFFRRDVDQLHQTTHALLQATDHVGIARLDIFGVLGTHLVWRDERALQVDANQSSLVFGRLKRKSGIHHRTKDSFGIGHGGGTYRGHAA